MRRRSITHKTSVKEKKRRYPARL